MIRKIFTSAVLTLGLVALSATPAGARPGEPVGETKIVCTVKLFWPISQQLCFEVPR